MRFRERINYLEGSHGIRTWIKSLKLDGNGALKIGNVKG